MEQNEKLRALETLQKKLYAYNCASNSLYLDAVTVAPKNTAEGRGVALSILAGELQKLMTAPETLALVEELYARRETLDTLHRREVEEQLPAAHPHPRRGVYGIQRADQPRQ